MIKSFKNTVTAAVGAGRCPKAFPSDISRVARRKLGMVDAAVTLNDLARPPGNKLHALTEDRAGQHAIWINDQFRVCFTWTDEGRADVEIVDYH